MPTRSHSEFFLTPLLILVIGPSFMSISSLVPELWQFPFISDWPEIGKSKISPSKFDPIYGDWGELEIPNLAQLSPMKCYWILQDARVTAFTVSELLRENHQEGWGGGGEGKITLTISTQIRVKFVNAYNFTWKWICHRITS